MKVKIYQLKNSITQSAPDFSNIWRLEFIENNNDKNLDFTMGWTSNENMNHEIHLNFHSKEKAIDYALKHNLEISEIEEDSEDHSFMPKSYADNFKASRS